MGTELWGDGVKIAYWPDPDESYTLKEDGNLYRNGTVELWPDSVRHPGPSKDIHAPVKDRTNCPNCGAPFAYGQTGCEYCGTGLPAKVEPRLRTEKDGKIVTSTIKMDASSIQFISSLMTVNELKEMMGYGRGPAIGDT